METEPGFRIIPAVDLKEGKCVTLVGGDPGKRISEEADPLAQARRWQESGASMLHLIDLDGALQGMPANMDIVRDIVESMEIPVEFGGGIRSREAASEVLDSGVWRVILGTLALQEPETVAGLSSGYGPSRVMVALDFRGDRVVTHGWQSTTGTDPYSAASRFEDLGAGSILFTNVDVEGRMEGLPLDPIRRMVETVDIEVVASGGISNLDDIIAVKSTGADAAVVGAAIYTGRINLREAILKVQG